MTETYFPLIHFEFTQVSCSFIFFTLANFPTLQKHTPMLSTFQAFGMMRPLQNGFPLQKVILPKNAIMYLARSIASAHCITN